MSYLSITGPRGIKRQILKLRSQGKTYSEIEKQLECSKGTIAYHCNKDYRGRAKVRTQKNRKNNLNVIVTNKLCAFKIRRAKNNRKYESVPRALWRRNIKSKMCRFKNCTRKGEAMRIGNYKQNYGSKEVLNKIQTEEGRAKCYLTGRDIDLKDTRSYHFDHIIPRSKGGTNDLHNLGVACRDANSAKSDMLTGEFIGLCKDTLEHHGYKVTDK